VRTVDLAHPLRFLTRRSLLSAADHVATNPLIRWTWTGPANEDHLGALPEFRPTDRETVLELIQGRYLLASKLVDTHGASPFSLDVDHGDWHDDLQAFAWLRHFRDARTETERAHARELTLDWINRDGRFSRENWGASVTARRVLNWLRHYNILLEGATPDEARRISRSLSMQVSSLRLRGLLVPDPVDALLVAIALVGVALSADRPRAEVEARGRRVLQLLDEQIDEDGLHRTRSARTQVQVLVELITIKLALRRDHENLSRDLEELGESMHRALDAISLGTGEPGYFNGTGQMPHDLMVAVQAQSVSRARQTGIAGGYGRLIAGRSIVVADSGLVPDPAYAANAHAGAMAFEFSHGRDLVVGNCGPAPADYDDQLLFRQGIAHSAPTINAASAASIPTAGPMAGRLIQLGRPGEIEARPQDETLVITSHGYAERFGVTLERHLTFYNDGTSLVGHDRFLRHRPKVSGAAAIRFHLAHQTEVQVEGETVRLRLASGANWTFFWEHADLRIEDSVRQSAYFGFHRTKQLVLDALVADTSEVSWIFTLDGA